MKALGLWSTITVFAGLLTGLTGAQEISKANNTTPLNEAASWLGEVVPGGANVAVWDATVAGEQTVDIGGALTWDGLRIANPGGAITINGASKLTLDGGAATDLDLSAASQDLTINTPLSLAGNQIADIAAGRTLTLNGASGIGTFIKTNAGLLVINGPATFPGDHRIWGGTEILRGDTLLSAGGTETMGIFNGTLILDGGTFQMTNAAGRLFAGRTYPTSEGLLIVSNGIHQIAGLNNSTMANFIGVSSGKRGRLIMEGGSITFKYLRLATNVKGGQVEGVPDEIVVNGGTLTANGSSTGFMMATPHNENSSGVSSRSGRLTLTGGRFEIPNGLTLIAPDTAADAHSGAAEILLNGGVWAVKQLTFGTDANVTRSLTFDGGTLEGTNAVSGAELVENPPPFKVRSKGAFLSAAPDTDFRVTATFEEDPASPGGALVKTGAGRLSLNGTHTLTGPTIVSNGMLCLTGSLAGHTNLIVNAGAGLSLADGSLAPFAPTSLRIGLGSQPSRLELEVAEAGAACDHLVIPTGAWFQRVTLDLVVRGTRTPVSREGDFPVLVYEGAAPALTSLTCGNPALGFACTFSLDTGTRTVTAHVRADVASGEAVWASPAGGTWATAANWNFPPISSLGNGVTFGPILAAPGTVTLDAPFTLGRLTFNNAQAYTLTGAGTLNFDNGANAATLSASGGNHTLAIPLALNTSLTALIADAAQIVQLVGPVSGPGGLIKIGDGDLELAADNTYAGGTTLSGGNLTVRQPGASFGTGPIRLNVAIGGESGRLRNRSAAELVITNDVIVTMNQTAIEATTAPIRLTGLLDFQAPELQKAGTDELVLAGTTEASGNYKLNIRNGAVRVSAGGRFLVNNSSARDTLYLADAATAPRSFTVDAGAEVLAGGLYTGSTLSNTVTLNGGTLTLAGSGGESGLIRTTVGIDGVDRIVINAGSLIVTPNRWLSLGVRAGTAELIVNGGTAEIGNLSLGVRADIGYSSGASSLGCANVIVNNGTLNVTKILNWMGDIHPARTNTVTLNGGTLCLPPTFRSIPDTVPNVSRCFLNGGTLELAASTGYANTSLENHLNGLTDLIIDQGGAIINTLANSAIITQAVQRADATSGGLTKRGVGSLTFTSASAYTGPTAVESGTLRFAAGTATTGLTLAPGTAFSLCGDTFDALTLTSASLGAGARLDLDVSPDDASCDTIALPADATLGTLVIGLFDVGTGIPAARLNTAWPIFSYAATPPDVSGWQLAPECFGAVQFTTNTAAQTIEVTLSSSELFVSWANSGAGDWSTGANWTPLAPAAAGASVLFGNALTADATVNVDAPVSVAGLRFDHTLSYTLAGSLIALDNADAPADIRVLHGTHTLAAPLAADNGATVTLASGTTLRVTDELTGAGALAVMGGGTLVLDGTNHTATAVGNAASLAAPTADAFDGPLTMVGGSVAVAQGGTLLQPVTLGADGGTFSAGEGQTLTLNTAVSGAGGLTKTGTGILDLDVNAAYTGMTTSDGGTVSFAALPTGPLTLGRGTLAFIGTDTTEQPVTVNPGAHAAVVKVDGDLTFSGPVTALTGGFFKRGAGTLRITGATENQLALNAIGNAEQVAVLGPDGDGPTVGAAGLSVAEGTLALGAPGQTNRIAGSLYVGLNTTTNAGAETAGELVIAGGYTEVGDYLCIGRNNGSTLTAPQGLASRVTVQAGTLVVTNISMSANTSLGGALYTGRPELIVNNGTLHVIRTFQVAKTPGCVATITVNGGALRHDAVDQSLRLGQDGGEGILRVTGGTFESPNDLIVGYGGAGSTGTVELTGGELIVKRLYSFNTASYSRVLFNGGVFKPTSGGLDTTLDVTAIGDAPAIFDTSLWAGADTFGLSATLTSAGATDGGLVKAGAGEMRVDAAQEYVGPTVISNGTLWVRSAGRLPAASALTVAPGAIFRIGNLPTTNVTVSALTLGDATDPAPATLMLGFDYATGTSDRMTVTGDVAAHRAVITCIWREATNENNVPNGRYELLRWTGNGPITADAFSVTNPVPGKDYLLTVENKALVLTVGPSTSGVGAHVWSATGGGNWSEAAKWVAAPGAGAAGAVVRFDTTITAPAAVALDQNATAGQLYFNSSNAYTLAQAGHALTLDNNGGPALIHLEQGRHTVASPIALVGPTTIKAFSGTALTLNGTISGDGGLIKDNSGELLIGSSGNTFTGGVRFAASGQLALTNGADTGTGRVTFETAGTLCANGTAPVSASGGIAVQTVALTTVDVAAQAPLTVHGLDLLTGASLTKTGAGDLIFAGSADVGADTTALLAVKQGVVRFAPGSNYRIGQTVRDGIYLSFNSADAKGLAVDAGGRASLCGIYTGYGTNTVIAVNGQLDLTGTATGDAVCLRVQDNTSPDCLVVNPGGVLTTSGGGFINVGIRGPAEFLLNGGEAHVDSVALGYQNSAFSRFGGSYGHTRVTADGLLDVSSRWWWMADSNNAARVNWLIADNGGTARLPNTRALHTTGWTILALDNGTLRASGTGLDSPTADDYLSGLQTFFIGHGGATVDTDGKDLAISQKVAYDSTSTFTKTGAGTLSLGQTLTWPGSIDVQAGVLDAALTSGVARATDWPTGLLARYSSEGGPGLDSSGHARHGNAWGNAITPVTDATGGAGLNFPLGSIVAVPMDATMRGMDAYTVATWVKVATVSGGGTISTFFTTRMSNSNDPYQFMLRTMNGKLRYMATGATINGWSSNSHDSTLPVPANEWFHAVCTVTASTLNLYVNGQPAGSWTKTNLKFCPPDRPLGGLGFGVGHPYLKINPAGEFAGQVDDVQIYDRALSDAEVAALVAAPQPTVPTLRVANGASAALRGATTVRTLSGEGYIAGGPLTVLGTVSPGDAAGAPAGAVLLADDLVLPNGITYRWDWSASANDVLRTTHLTIDGAGKLDLGRAEGSLINGSFRAVLATYDTLTGAANLAAWTVINAGGKGYVAEIKAENGEVFLAYQSTRGSLMFLK